MPRGRPPLPPAERARRQGLRARRQMLLGNSSHRWQPPVVLSLPPPEAFIIEEQVERGDPWSPFGWLLDSHIAYRKAHPETDPRLPKKSKARRPVR